METKKVAVITGASAGIGMYTAHTFMKKGWRVFNLSRTSKNCKAEHIACDVTNDQSVVNAVNKVIELAGKIDIAILNAGYGISGAAEFTDINNIIKQFDVNFFGVTRCVNNILPYLRQTKGKLIFVSSMAGALPIPFQSYYSASKAAICNYARCLKSEVRKSGVTISIMLPGDVKTEFTANRIKNDEKLTNEVYGSSATKAVSIMEKDETNGMSPQKIANKLIKMSKKKKLRAYYTVGFQYKLFLFLSKLLPNSLIDFVIRLMYKI